MAESKKEKRPRRIRGEGSLYRRHTDECPPEDAKGNRPKHSCNGLWVGTIDLGWHSGKRIRKSVTGKTAKIVQAKFIDLKKTVEKGGGLTKNVTVTEWLNHWLEYIVSERNEASTLESYRSWTNTWLIPYLGQHRLDRLSEDHIRSMLAEMKKQGRSDGTRRRTYAILRRALVVAMRESRIQRNPAAMIDAPSTDVIHRLPLTVAQAKQILAHLDGHPLAARWVASLLQGMRQGECLALKWKDVDFVNEEISINQSQVRLTGQGIRTKAPKSKASTRIIPMTSLMRYALEKTEHRGDFVFYGEPKDRRSDWKEWKQLLIDAGVFPEGTPFGDMPALACGRPTTGTLLRDAGVADTVIRDILGHSQVQVTQESYQRTDQPTKKKGMKALETLVSLSPKKSDQESTSQSRRKCLGSQQIAGMEKRERKK